ncbi:sulfotransferase 1C2-like [Mercenaria mercenaria]|uniref:sulfotransferase 1C2-like n=1 Tax=Mercenaria mercenaria TaxID=6596 RepID=UPI00234EAFAE|nr:sulfotransferase 1C2-like [Mercenaria mercenaria]
MEWERIEVRDENGVGFDLIQHEELILPATLQHMEHEKQLKMIREFKYKKGDILLCSYPKTGTHWLSNLVYFLVTPGSVESMKTVQPTLMDLVPLEPLEKVEHSRVLNSHHRINRLPFDHLEQGGKIIVLTRDPKDAMVSYKYHVQNFEMLNRSNLSWNNFFDIWVNGKLPCGSFFDYYNSWEKALKENKELNVLIVHFEHLKTNGLKELRRIQDFLEVNNTEERLKEILDKCNVTKMKADIDTGEVESLLKDSDGKSFLYRKGESGDWKNHFTVALNEHFDNVLEERFKDSIFNAEFLAG